MQKLVPWIAGFLVVLATAVGVFWQYRRVPANSKQVLHITNRGVYLDKKLVSRVIDGDIEKQNLQQGADYKLFQVLNQVSGAAGANQQQSVPRMFEVHIERDVPTKIVHRELLAAQQAEYLSFNLRIPKSCGQYAGMAIPFMSYHHLVQQPVVNVMIEKNTGWTVSEVEGAYPPHPKNPERPGSWRFPGEHASDAMIARIEASVKKWKSSSLFYFAEEGSHWGLTEDFVCKLKKSSLLREFVNPVEMIYTEGRWHKKHRQSGFFLAGVVI